MIPGGAKCKDSILPDHLDLIIQIHVSRILGEIPSLCRHLIWRTDHYARQNNFISETFGNKFEAPLQTIAQCNLLVSLGFHLRRPWLVSVAQKRNVGGS